MKFILILFLLPLVFAQAPVEDVMQNNDEAAPLLEGHYNESFAQNGSAIFSFENRTEYNFTASFSMEIAGMNLMLDNMTYPAEGLSVILARGAEIDHLVAKPADGYLDFICDLEWYESPSRNTDLNWRCDHDDDFCLEYENRTLIEYDMEAELSFRNTSYIVPLGSSNIIPIPEDVLEDMKTASGADTLNIKIEGNAIIVYEFNDQHYEGISCANRYVNQSITIPYSVNRSFLVAGQQKLFFLKSPVLREQWFRNNRFDTIVLSQSPLYFADIALNNNQSTTNATLREFNVTTNEYGLQEIISNKTNETFWSESRNITTPTPLETESNSFAFIYGFNYSYQGLGKNNLSIHVVDSFGGEAVFNETLLSRMLSYNGNITETGEPYNETTARKSVPFEKEDLANVEITLGVLALMVFVIFMKFWGRR